MTAPQASPAVATVARTMALQMLQEHGRGAVLVGVVRVDALFRPDGPSAPWAPRCPWFIGSS